MLAGAAATTPASVPYMHPAAAAYGLTAGPQLGTAAQEQELMYRELLSRMQYNTDPVLAQQASSFLCAAVFFILRKSFQHFTSSKYRPVARKRITSDTCKKA